MSEQSSRIRVLALGAHPDDIEAGCGGALIKYARAGHQVFQMVLTEGEEGGEQRPPAGTGGGGEVDRRREGLLGRPP